MSSPEKRVAGHDPSAPTVRTGPNLYHLEESLSPAALAVFEECRTHLHTGVLDWVVTDGDTKNVMDALARLSYAEMVAVMHRLGEAKDGSSNLLEKLYARGIESAAQVAEWRKLLYDKFVGAQQDGKFPDLNKAVGEYQEKYVAKEVLARGF